MAWPVRSEHLASIGIESGDIDGIDRLVPRPHDGSPALDDGITGSTALLSQAAVARLRGREAFASEPKVIEGRQRS